MLCEEVERQCHNARYHYSPVYPIRVLHVVAGMGMGGYENLIMNIYRNINREKVQFDFLLSFPGCFCDEIEALGGKIYQTPFITKVGPFVYAAKIREILITHPEYKIVHSHMDKFSGLIMEIAKKQGIPVRIAHSHSTANEGPLAYQVVKNYYGRKIKKNCTHRFAFSDKAAAWLFGEQSKETITIKNGIELRRYQRNLTKESAVLTVVNVARFTDVKNHRFLLKIFAEVKK